MGKKWLGGYKVVRRQGNRLVSCVIHKIHGWGWKVYAIGRITKRTGGRITRGVVSFPSYGPLAVFDHKQHAAGYMEKMDDPELRLYKCRYVKSKHQEYWLPGYRQRTLAIGRVWGEAFADEVELVEEVN